ncbi:MAG TPA: hypothetical protein VFS34_03690 [Thermoanaerobaculia bacterium]|nr:hypothetical protein [Thermoanaerobaculia bacterium]
MNTWQAVLSEASKSLKDGNEDFAESWGVLREEAVSRGEQLLDDAKRHAAALLALAAERGVHLAKEYGVPLVAGRPHRRRSAWKWVIGAAAIAVIAAGIASRD